MADNLTDLVKLRAFLIKQARELLDDNGFIEVQAPIIVPCFGGQYNAFEVEYFDKKAMLTKGFLPYGNFFADRFGKVYTLNPSFRKEAPSNRHLCEYWRLEAIQHCTLDDILDLQETLVTELIHCLPEISENVPSLQSELKSLEKIEKPFIRLSYDEAIHILQKTGHTIFWGQEINSEQEKQLSLKFEQPFFIHLFPYGPDKFLHATNTKRSELSLSADLIAPSGYGELASSLQMLTQKKQIITRMQELGFDEENQKWFSNFFSDTANPSAAFALGIERVLQWICKVDQIEDTTAFPRSYKKLYP